MGKLKSNESHTQTVMGKNNYNEQYSRNNNSKIMGVKDDTNETAEMLKDKICEIQSTKAGFLIDPRNIHAIHPIQGKAYMRKPVLLKTKNNHEKTKIMRKNRNEEGWVLLN